MSGRLLVWGMLGAVAGALLGFAACWHAFALAEAWGLGAVAQDVFAWSSLMMAPPIGAILGMAAAYFTRRRK